MSEGPITESLRRREMGSVPPHSFMRHALNTYDIHAVLQHLKNKYRNTFKFIKRSRTKTYMCYATNGELIQSNKKLFFICCAWYTENKIVTCADTDILKTRDELFLDFIPEEPRDEIQSNPLQIIEDAFKKWLHRRTLFEKVIINLRSIYFELHFSFYSDNQKHGIYLHDQLFKEVALDKFEKGIAPNPRKFQRMHTDYLSTIERFISANPILTEFEIYRGVPGLKWSHNRICYTIKNMNNQITVAYRDEAVYQDDIVGFEYIQYVNFETIRNRLGFEGHVTIYPSEAEYLKVLRIMLRDLVNRWPSMSRSTNLSRNYTEDLTSIRGASTQLQPQTPWTTLERLLNIVSARL